MAVADAELGIPVRLPIGLLEAGRLDEHWCDKKHRHMAVIGEDGEADHPVLGQLVAFCNSNPVFSPYLVFFLLQASGLVPLTRARAPLTFAAEQSSSASLICSLLHEMQCIFVVFGIGSI